MIILVLMRGPLAYNIHMWHLDPHIHAVDWGIHTP